MKRSGLIIAIVCLLIGAIISFLIFNNVDNSEVDRLQKERDIKQRKSDSLNLQISRMSDSYKQYIEQTEQYIKEKDDSLQGLKTINTKLINKFNTITLKTATATMLDSIRLARYPKLVGRNELNYSMPLPTARLVFEDALKMTELMSIMGNQVQQIDLLERTVELQKSRYDSALQIQDERFAKQVELTETEREIGQTYAKEVQEKNKEVKRLRQQRNAAAALSVVITVLALL